MKDIMETLQALQNTPVPNLLVIAGFILLLLAFVGRIGTVIELPRKRQRWAGIIGALLLIFGIGLFIVPGSQSDSSPPDVVTTHAPTRIPTPNTGRTKEPRIVLPVCDCEETITTDEPIVIRLRWGAKTQALTENGADFVVYNALVNGNPIQGLNEYRKPAEFVPGSDDNEDIWWVYWDYPLGTLAEGEYVIESEIFTSASISDGWTTIPANSPVTHKVILHVVPPSNP
jgi:hypothetical protein